MNIRHRSFAACLAAAVAAMSLSGCAGIAQTRQTQQGIVAAAHRTYQSMPASRHVVETHRTPWLMGEAIKSSKAQPAILDKSVVFKMDVSGWSIKDYAYWLMTHVGVNVNVDQSAEQGSFGASGGAESFAHAPAAIPLPSAPTTKGSASGASSIPSLPSALLSDAMSAGMVDGLAQAPKIFSYTGNLKGFLDRITARQGVYWHYRNSEIAIFRTETRTWTLPSLPIASSSMGSISSSGSTGAGGQTGMAGNADSTLMSTSTSSMGGAAGGAGGAGGGMTSMNTSVAVNYWGSLQQTAQAVAGPGVQIAIDKSFGTLTATGTPPQIERLNTWVQGVDAMLRKQVAIEVHVYNVQITREDNYGLNLGLALSSPSGHSNFKVASAGIPNITSTSSPMTFGANIVGGTLNGTAVAVQALSSLGNVSQVVSRSGVTLNGQMLALQAARVQNYLASSQTTLASTVGSTTALQPGSVTIGFTGTFLPKVVDGRIMIDLNMTLSDLLGITSATSGTSTIQLPNVTTTTFEQSVALKPGQTLVLTGYRQHTAAVTNNGIGSPDFAALGGGVDAQRGDTILAVVISARIL
uniref:PilN n=1 Tax=mine drainage metagenome TaxID=410659 RepID=E6QMU5_9ZZZZ